MGKFKQGDFIIGLPSANRYGITKCGIILKFLRNSTAKGTIEIECLHKDKLYTFTVDECDFEKYYPKIK